MKLPNVIDNLRKEIASNAIITNTMDSLNKP
jgi:hypothetical protein